MKNKDGSCIVFLKNENDGSSYYRLFQYMKNCRIINMTPSFIYKFYYGSKKSNNKIKKIIMGVITLLNVILVMIYDTLIWKSQTIIMNRRFFPRSCPHILELLLERYLDKKNVYWDFDDNIRYDGEISEAEADLLEKKADCIIVTNEFLSETISAKYRNKVRIIPTTDCEFEDLNIDESVSQRKISYNEEIVMCWIGTMNNLKYLSGIIQALDDAAKYCKTNLNKKLILKVVANKKLEECPECLLVENIEWTRDVAISVMKSSHIGLMPLVDNEYTRGKGGFKAIQYMSAAIVPLLSNVGYNSNVIIDNESGLFCNSYSDWKEKIISICRDVKLWEQLALGARQRWVDKFNPEPIKCFWNRVIEEDI